MPHDAPGAPPPDMAALVAAHDWAATPIGPADAWPQPLRTLVAVLTGSRQPMFVTWGPERTLIYNEGYAPLLAERHPLALGQPFLRVWSEVAVELTPLLEAVDRGESIHMDDIQLLLRRHGREEEAHFAFSYTPVRDEAGAVAGLFCACTETTAQVMTERARVAEAERLRQLFGQAPGFMCVLRSPDHVYEMTNRAYDALIGRSGVVGQRIADVLPEIAEQGFIAILDEVYAANRPYAGTDTLVRLQRPDGGLEERWLNFIMQPIADADGAVSGIFIEGSDVTAAHQVQDVLRAERDRTQAILQNVSEGFVLYDSAFRVLQINAEALRMDGRPASALMGRTLWEAWPELGGTPAGEAFRDAMATREPRSLEHSHSPPHGRTAWVDLRVYPSGDGLAAFSRDVTARKEAEARLLESEARFRAITDSIDHMVWSTMADGHHDYYNQRWYDYTGVSPGSTDGEGWNGLFHPDDQQRAWGVWRHSLATGEPYHIEYRLRHRSGEYRWVLGRAQPVRDEAGRVIRWYGTCTEIHDIVAAREVLARSREHLEQIVAARTADLLDANARLQAEAAERERVEDALRQSQKMEAVGQLTGGIAHDFNNMLQAVSGALEVMERRIAQGRPEDIGRLLGMAQQGVERAALLTQRLLAFARRQTLDPKPVAPDELVAGLAELVERTVGRAVAVRTELGAEGAVVRCDANQLENAVLNLAINARDAMPEGGQLTLATAAVRLGPADVAGHDVPAGEYVEVSVADTGGGMTPDVMARAFEPFFTTKPLGQGTGLGLSQLYGFVRQSGGLVRLGSVPGQGTTVRILLPRYQGEAAEAAGAAPGQVLDGPPAHGTVLVVEDEDAIRALLAGALREAGYAVNEASDGPSGLRALDSAMAVDLLVTDVGLPGLNGRQLADAGRVRRPGLRVLFITGYDGGGAAALEPGMSVLAKPFELDTLMGKVRDMLAS